MSNEKMSGIEKLRKLADDVLLSLDLYAVLRVDKEIEYDAELCGKKLNTEFRELADQIEREHAEELAKLTENRRALINEIERSHAASANHKHELKKAKKTIRNMERAAQRDLTDEARAVVKRFRDMDFAKPKADLYELVFGEKTPPNAKNRELNESISNRLCTLIEHGTKKCDENSVEMTFFKPSGKYYTEETIEFPEELRGSINAKNQDEIEAASELMYKRRLWLKEAVEDMYVGMHAVSLSSDAIGFPMMLVRSSTDRNAMYQIIDKLEKHSTGYGSFESEIAKSILDAMDDGGAVQDVDVAALLELAEKMRICADNNIGASSKVIGAFADTLRKAVEGAPKPDADREAAADWVEQQGGLEEVKHHYAFMVDQVAKHVGIQRGAFEPEHVTIDKIMMELDKRLMPPGMEWPRFEDGEKVTFGDRFNHTEGYSNIPVEGFEFFDYGGAVYQINGIREPFCYGERVKCPAPEVLGADGKPIKVGDTVSNDYTTHTVAEVHASAAPSGGEYPWVRYEDEEWDFAITVIHGALETQERIDEDKRKNSFDYWECGNCTDCPALIDGMHPRKYYGVLNCGIAQGMDIARRQRELDAKTAGGK